MLRMVFSDARFSAMAAAVFAVLAFALLFMSEYIFLEPYLVGHVPRDSELGLALIILIAAMSAVAIPANVYRVVMLSSPGRKMGGGIAGSVLGTAAGACSCGTGRICRNLHLWDGGSNCHGVPYRVRAATSDRLRLHSGPDPCNHTPVVLGRVPALARRVTIF